MLVIMAKARALMKARAGSTKAGHKYISRKKKGQRWEYKYVEDKAKGGARRPAGGDEKKASKPGKLPAELKQAVTAVDAPHLRIRMKTLKTALEQGWKPKSLTYYGNEAMESTADSDDDWLRDEYIDTRKKEFNKMTDKALRGEWYQEVGAFLEEDLEEGEKLKYPGRREMISDLMDTEADFVGSDDVDTLELIDLVYGGAEKYLKEPEGRFIVGLEIENDAESFIEEKKSSVEQSQKNELLTAFFEDTDVPENSKLGKLIREKSIEMSAEELQDMLSEIPSTKSERKETAYMEQARDAVYDLPISKLRKIARDQEMTDDIDWSSQEQASAEIWDLVFKSSWQTGNMQELKDLVEGYGVLPSARKSKKRSK